MTKIELYVISLMFVITCQVLILEVNKFSPAANTYDIGTTIGKAPAISISGRDKEPAECKYQISCPSYYWGSKILKVIQTHSVSRILKLESVRNKMYYC